MNATKINHPSEHAVDRVSRAPHRTGGSVLLDDFTLAHVVDNIATTSSPNIAGSYKRLR